VLSGLPIKENFWNGVNAIRIVGAIEWMGNARSVGGGVRPCSMETETRLGIPMNGADREDVRLLGAVIVSTAMRRASRASRPAAARVQFVERYPVGPTAYSSASQKKPFFLLLRTAATPFVGSFSTLSHFFVQAHGDARSRKWEQSASTISNPQFEKADAFQST